MKAQETYLDRATEGEWMKEIDASEATAETPGRVHIFDKPGYNQEDTARIEYVRIDAQKDVYAYRYKDSGMTEGWEIGNSGDILAAADRALFEARANEAG